MIQWFETALALFSLVAVGLGVGWFFLYAFDSERLRRAGVSTTQAGCRRCLYLFAGWAGTICPECGLDARTDGVCVGPRVPRWLRTTVVKLSLTTLACFGALRLSTALCAEYVVLDKRCLVSPGLLDRAGVGQTVDGGRLHVFRPRELAGSPDAIQADVETRIVSRRFPALHRACTTVTAENGAARRTAIFEPGDPATEADFIELLTPLKSGADQDRIRDEAAELESTVTDQTRLSVRASVFIARRPTVFDMLAIGRGVDSVRPWTPAFLAALSLALAGAFALVSAVCARLPSPYRPADAAPAPPR